MHLPEVMLQVTTTRQQPQRKFTRIARKAPSKRFGLRSKPLLGEAVAWVRMDGTDATGVQPVFSHGYRKLMERFGLRASMSRRANFYDNALMRSPDPGIHRDFL